VRGRLALQLGQPAPDPPRRDHEHRQQHQRQQRDLPGQLDHHDQREGERDQVADHAGQRVAERSLGPDHVVVEPADQRPGAGAGEERHRLALHVVEHGRPQVEDQVLTEGGGEPALPDPAHRLGHRDSGDQHREPDHRADRTAVHDGVHDPPGQHRGGHGQYRTHDADHQERDQTGPVWVCEPGDPAQRRP
jgi:hypothetical protein